MGPTNEAPDFPITYCRAARSGCLPTARGRFVHPAGRNGRCGSIRMETSVRMRCRSQGSADVTAADSPARSPISPLGGNNRSSDTCRRVYNWHVSRKGATVPIGAAQGCWLVVEGRHADIVCQMEVRRKRGCGEICGESLHCGPNQTLSPLYAYK